MGFKSLVQYTSPTLWSFLDALKLEQGLTEQKIADRLMLRAPEPRAKKWIEVDQKWIVVRLDYSRTSLTRGFWEEKNRSKKPRVVEVPRVREGS